MIIVGTTNANAKSSCSYLPQRYPSLYRKTSVGMDNLVTGESFNILERPVIEDPMQIAGRMVQDDLAIMFERPDGQYYLLAGSILLAGFWRLEDKWAMPLSEIHTSGDVPGFKQKLEKGMMNFFRSPRWSNSRTYPEGWLAQFGAGEMTLLDTRAERSIRKFCWNI